MWQWYTRCHGSWTSSTERADCRLVRVIVLERDRERYGPLSLLLWLPSFSPKIKHFFPFLPSSGDLSFSYISSFHACSLFFYHLFSSSSYYVFFSLFNSNVHIFLQLSPFLLSMSALSFCLHLWENGFTYLTQNSLSPPIFVSLDLS